MRGAFFFAQVVRERATQSLERVQPRAVVERRRARVERLAEVALPRPDTNSAAAALSSTAARAVGGARPSSTASTAAAFSAGGPPPSSVDATRRKAESLRVDRPLARAPVADLDHVRRTERRDLIHPRFAVHDQRVHGAQRPRARPRSAARVGRPPHPPPAVPRSPDWRAARRCSSRSGFRARGAPAPRDASRDASAART